MDFLSGLFGAKKPLSSTAVNRPNSNLFATNNPEVVPPTIQDAFAKFIAAWKRKQINESERHRAALAAFAREHPAEMRAFLEGRLAASSPDVRGLSAENIPVIKEFILQAGGKRSSKGSLKARKTKKTQKAKKSRKAKKAHLRRTRKA
jgi:hypothetical protein